MEATAEHVRVEVKRLRYNDGTIEPLESAIGRTILFTMNEQDLTTTQLAQKVGISQAQISRLENGKQGFRSSTLHNIATALGIDFVVTYGEQSK